MAGSILYQDGAQPYGSRILTIGGTAFPCDDWNFGQQAEQVNHQDELNNANGFTLSSPNPPEGSCTVQVASSSTYPPALGATFTDTVDGASATYVVKGVERIENKGAYRQYRLTFVKDIVT